MRFGLETKGPTCHSKQHRERRELRDVLYNHSGPVLRWKFDRANWEVLRESGNNDGGPQDR